MKIFPIDDLIAVTALLKSVNLPVDDVMPNDKFPVSCVQFFGSFHNATLASVIGCELYENVALLRSMAVATDYRRAGIAAELIRTVERVARNAGVQDIYLLTLDAEGYFLRHGYSLIERNQAPVAIQTTTQFCALCPGSAKIMMKVLNDVK